MALQVPAVYFKNLNALRCFAAMAVLFQHINTTVITRRLQQSQPFELYKKLEHQGLPGQLAVVLFFVLSGFLITGLLLLEKKHRGNIAIRKFLMRRILRIWPLYYLVILLSLLILFSNEHPDINLLAIKLILFVLMLPQMINIFFQGIPYSTHSWSIGVEEQFYLIWPFVLKKIATKKLFSIILVSTLIILIIKAIFQHILWLNMLLTMIHMMIGSLFAIIWFQKEKYHKLSTVLYSLPFQLFCYLLFLLYFFSGYELPFCYQESYALLFGIMIFNLATNPKNLVHLEYPVLNYLGKISYGIYMLHPFCILISEKALDLINGYHISLHFILSSILSILAASLSYSYFEKPFLTLKQKYSFRSTLAETRPNQELEQKK